jgi:HSP20 family molecular chaperone IbpA
MDAKAHLARPSTEHYFKRGEQYPFELTQGARPMREKPAPQRQDIGTQIKPVPARVLVDRINEMHDMIARRAYEIFESRGRADGHVLEDWVQSESELLYSCSHDVKESAEAFVLDAELPGTFTADQINFSVEPRRLIISGERELNVLCGDSKGTHSELRPQRILRMHNLPVDVDPSQTVAMLKGETLEIVMPKVTVANRPDIKAEAAAAGG